MGALPPLNEMIGLFVATALALAFVSYLLYARGMDAGVARRRVWRTIALFWVLSLGLMTLLFGVRALIGTPLVEGSPTEGGGLSFAQMNPLRWGLLAVAMGAVAAGACWLRRLVQSLEGRPPTPPKRSDSDSDPNADQTC